MPNDVADLNAAWALWLSESGPQSLDLDAEDATGVLIRQFQNSCSVEMLIEVCIGQFFTACRVARAGQAEAVESEFRARGLAVRTERAADLAAGV
jgi:hypothetical protein